MEKVRIVVCVIVAFLSFFSINVFAKTANSNAYDKFIVMPFIWDTYLKEEIPKPIPKYGQVLCVSNKMLSSRVVNGKIRFKEVGYILENENGLQPTILGCNSKEKALFFITDKPKKLLAEGKANTIYMGKGENASINKLKLKFNGKEYSLIHDKKGCNTRDNCNYKVVLSTNNQKQKIIERNIFDRTSLGGNPTLIWAGDTDKDNKLDFVIAYIVDDSNLTYELFLSSQARKGELVRPVKKLTYWLE